MIDRIEALETQMAETEKTIQKIEEVLSDICKYLGLYKIKQEPRCVDCGMDDNKCVCDKCFSCGEVSCIGDCHLWR
jgi:hypothetical protein